MRGVYILQYFDCQCVYWNWNGVALSKKKPITFFNGSALISIGM